MTRLKRIITIFILFITYFVNGQNVTATSATLNGSAILTSAPALTVQDPLYGILTDADPLNDDYFTSTNVCAKIHFGFDDAVFNNLKFAKVYKAKVTLAVRRYDRNNVYTDESLTLEIEHDNVNDDRKIRDYVVRKFTGVHKLETRVTSIVYYNLLNNIITVAATDNSAYLKLTFETERYYNIASTKLALTENVVTYTGLTANVLPSTGVTGNASELQIGWSILNNGNAPVEYELEWSWVDNYNATLSSPLLKNQINYTEADFMRNSTRIQTKDLFYRIPLVYNKGYLIYRVRPVGRFLSDISKIYLGSWTTEYPQNYLTIQNWPNVVEINLPHEGGKKNWQFQSSYAEDGKKKDVVSYFDGSLRNRQTVSKVNTNNQTVVGEVVYDTQGRAAVEVLPAPVVSGELKYFKNLSLNEGDAVFTHNDFDWEKSNLTVCTPTLSGGMSSTSGASNYYSDENPIQTGLQKFVPNAKKYPFSQIEYTPDNTGRIRKKGGVGPEHQIGSGHEMVYFYSKPTQEELNRLFGYKVGNSARYQKNMVVDPNKQVSISYIDPQGRTVATALAGDNPESLVPLDFVANSPRLALNILENNNPFPTGTNGVQNDGIQFNSVINIPKEDNLKLAYKANLTNAFYTADCTNKKYPFVYNIGISLKDDCGFERIVGGALSLNLGAESLSGADPGAVSINQNNILTDNLTIGTYNISKKLIINQTVLDNYANDYIAAISAPGQPCLPTFNFSSDFETDEDCNTTCSECELNLGKTYLSPADYDLFEDLFTHDGSTLGDISVRAPYVNKMEVGYIHKALTEVFQGITFTIVGNTITNSPTDNVKQEEINFATSQLRAEFYRNLTDCRDLCDQPISICSTNYELLLSDVSPTGQYGSTEGLLGGEAEDNGTPADDGEEDVPTTAPDFDKTSLSVFDDKNGLKFYAGIITPSMVTYTGTDESSSTVPVEFSAASWRNPIPLYKDNNDVEAWIPLVKIDEDSFEPAILHASYAVETPANSGHYFARPQHLLKFEDFYTNWNPNWATSLVVHHPEYNYYKYFRSLCDEKSQVPNLGTINSDTFDAKLRSLSHYDADATNLIQSIYSTIGLPYTTEVIGTSIDPFYKINYTVETDPEYKARLSLMKEALFHNYDGMKVGGVNLNLIATAYYFTVYANGLTPSNVVSTFSSTRGNIGTSNPGTYVSSFLNDLVSPLTNEQKDRFWANFVSYYTSIKEKTKTVFSHIYAKKYRGYNDCIGNPENTDTFQTIFLKQNGPVYNNFSTVLALTNPAISPTNAWPENVCNNMTLAAYKDKDKRFISADYGYNSGLPDSVIAAGVNGDTASSIFAETGKCPLLFDMENLLNGLIGNQDRIINSANTAYTNQRSLITGPNGSTLNDPLTNMMYLTTNLYSALGGGPFDSDGNYINPNVEYITSHIDSPATMRITVGSGEDISLNIISGNTNACNSLLPTPSWSNYLTGVGAYKITEFKGITYEIGSYSSATPYKFKILAKIERLVAADNCVIPEEIIIEGTTVAPIGECQFDSNGSVLTTNNETQTGGGCANKTRFENGLVKLMNELINEGNNNSATLLVSTDDYSYNGSIIPEILHAIDAEAWSTFSADSFVMDVSNGTSFGLALGGPAFVHGDKITSIQIGNEPNEDNQFPVTIYYLHSAHLLEMTGKISYIDFGCVCKERVYKPKRNAEVALEGLINDLWVRRYDITDGAFVSCPPNIMNPVCNFISTCDSNGVHQLELETYTQGSGGHQGMYFYFDKDAEKCRLTLDVFDIPDRTCVVSNFYDRVINFTDFEILERFPNGTYKFRLKAHYNEYNSGCPEIIGGPIDMGKGKGPGGNGTPLYPGGTRYVYGTVQCLNIECESLVNLNTALGNMLQDLSQQESVANGYVPSGYNVYSNSLPQDPTILPENSIGIRNYYANESAAGSQIGFNFNKTKNCELVLNIPNTQLAQIQTISNVIFDETLNNFTADVTRIDGSTIVASGVASCLELRECYEEVNIPCKTCIPKPIEAVSCSYAWNNFVSNYENAPEVILANFSNVIDNIGDINFAGQYFCQANYAYISDPYMRYLLYFGLNNSAGVDNPLFITLAEFGSTKLRYGYQGTLDAVNKYKQYYDDQMLHPNGYTKTWIEYIDQVYIVENDVCPPSPLIPTIPAITTGVIDPCEQFHANVTATYTSQALASMLEQKKEQFKIEYIKKAIESVKETFTKEGFDGEYQYTLYYYDQAGNLIQTVPPKGVDRLNTSTVINRDIDKARTDTPSAEFTNDPSTNTVVLPTHKMETQYKYNSLNQLVWQLTPDGDETQDGSITRFAYDGLGRIIASQNAKQRKISLESHVNIFSYTRYDGLGRIFEAGELQGEGNSIIINDNGKLEYAATHLPVPVDAVSTTVTPFPANIASNFNEVTRTKYDVPFNNSNQLFLNYSQDNGFKRVTSVLYFDQITPSTIETNYKNAIYYDYDVHGNVKEIVTDINDEVLRSRNHNLKRVVYDYDLISGNVNTVTYQPNDTDEQFIHKYKYDADNRIVDVQTSRDNVIWEKDAKYEYYAHGPLAKTTIGDRKVQEQDYLYTLQGWLKGVNSEKIGHLFDAGKNGLAINSTTNFVAQDAFGYALNYFKGDYKPIGSTTSTINNDVFSYTIDQGRSGGYDLYNGNIKEMTTAIIDQSQQFLPTQFNFYRYDQLNRISSMKSDAIFNDLFTPTLDTRHSIQSGYTYDANGNLSTLQRYAFKDSNYEELFLMDDLKYSYPNENNNQLDYVNDSVDDSEFDVDLDNQKEGNYIYDAIGELIHDEKEGIDISWRVDGKVNAVKKSNTGQTISFNYDGLGNRITKTVTEPDGTEKVTYYSRDAQGNVLCVYNYIKDDVKEPKNNKFYLAENDIYGSSRLGIESLDLSLGDNPAPPTNPLVGDITSTARVSLPPVENTLTPVPVLGGLVFNDGGQYAKWDNNYAKLNFNNRVGPLTEEFKISSNFKINGIVDGVKNCLVSLHSNQTLGNKWVFHSNVKVLITKDANGAFIPVILIEDHIREVAQPRGKKRKRYTITTRVVRSFTLNSAIPENEWNFNFRCSRDDKAGYLPYLELNGNVYSPKDFTIKDFPHIRYDSDQHRGAPQFNYNTNALGSYYIDYGEHSHLGWQFETAIALQADICDFTYSIDKHLKEEDDPKKEHIFLFDKTAPVNTRVEGYNATNYTVALQAVNGASIINNPASYCGSGILDSDGDTINDYTTDGVKFDNCPYTYNPGQEDGDGDGVGDVCDNCKINSNAGQEDDDADGVGNICDNCVTKFNPEQVDSDSDGHGDVCDNCPAYANADQLDANHNGIGDICEGKDQGMETAYTIFSKGNYFRTIGDKRYELSNHLGNVLSVVTDRTLLGTRIGKTSYVVLPDVISFNDYYPFGMLVPNRNADSDKYRYGFNTQEKVDEISGPGNHFTAPYWEYDPRIGRRWNLDPVVRPWESGYVANHDNPIRFSDPNGDDPDKPVKKHKTKSGDTYSSLSKKYGASESQLRKWNGYKDKGIPVGVELNVSDPSVIAKSVNVPGKGEDMGSGYLSIPELHGVLGSNTSGAVVRQGSTNKELEEDMMDLGMSFADTPEAKTMVKGIFTHFFNGGGADYSSNLLTKTVLNHPSTQRFIHGQIIPAFNKLVNAKGGFTAGSFDLNLSGNPRFVGNSFGIGTGDEDNGLKISINDVWAYKVKVVSYKEIENKYEAQLQLTLYDHFGLNASDITEHPYADLYTGFYSWYVLQWQRGYKPFITVIPIKITIQGTVKK